MALIGKFNFSSVKFHQQFEIFHVESSGLIDALLDIRQCQNVIEGRFGVRSRGSSIEFFKC